MSKVKMLLDVVNEVRKEAPEDVPNWSKRYEEAKQNLQNQIMKGEMTTNRFRLAILMI
mgnify:CR=1 FL=1